MYLYAVVQEYSTMQYILCYACMPLLLLSMDRKVMGSGVRAVDGAMMNTVIYGDVERACGDVLETNDHLHPFFLFFKLASESPFAFQKLSCFLLGM